MPKRAHFWRCKKSIKAYSFSWFHIGTSNDDKLDEINTAKQLIKLRPKIVRIYPVLVLKNTKLEEEFRSGEYMPLTVEQAVERSKEVMQLFNRAKIEVIRLGLQNTEEISDPAQEESKVVAGPYHPAFRQLVESSMWYDEIVAKIKECNAKVMQVRITANPENMNNIIGHKKENVLKLKEIYDVDVIVKADENIKKGKFKLDIEKTYDDALEEKLNKKTVNK